MQLSQPVQQRKKIVLQSPKQNEYAETNEGREMDKFIARAKVLGNL